MPALGRSPVVRRFVVVAALLAVGIGALTACAPPPPPPPPPPIAPSPTSRALAVATATVTFFDPTRDTPAFGWWPGQSGRTLPTRIWLPAARDDAPYPLVVFAPGYGVGPDAYATLLSRIASAGYVVAAPFYPILSGWPVGPSDTVDWEQKFPDTRFVTDSMLALSASDNWVFGGSIDPSRIAVAGHSDGALISFSDGFVAWRNDPRVRAVISYAALLGEPGTIYQPNGRAFLHVLSDQDVYNDLDESVAWDHDNLAGPRWTVGLWDASHEGPYMEPWDPHFALVVKTTISFLDQELKGASTFWMWLEVTTQPGLAAFL
jgi:acetyl esterase/lipase